MEVMTYQQAVARVLQMECERENEQKQFLLARLQEYRQAPPCLANTEAIIAILEKLG